MNQNHQVAEQEISFSNVHFWHWFLLLLRGFDEEKELNLDEAIQEAVGLNPYSKELAAWYQSFLPSENNSIRNYQFSISADIRVNIQFTQEQINYYLNDLYIGNLGGHLKSNTCDYNLNRQNNKTDYSNSIRNTAPWLNSTEIGDCMCDSCNRKNTKDPNNEITA